MEKEYYYDTKGGCSVTLFVFILLIVLSAFTCSGQDITSFSFSEDINFRNSKEDSIPFDWYTKQSISLELDSTYLMYAMYNIERDNGVEYYSYEVKFQTKYFTVRRYFDTEKEIDMYNSSVYYPVLKYFKVGYDFSYVSKEENHNAYIAFAYKDWIRAECAFLTDLMRYQVVVNPEFSIREKIKIGPIVDVLSVDDVIKWRCGLNFKVKIL